MRRWLVVVLLSGLATNCGSFLSEEAKSAQCVFDDSASKLDECKLAP
jgi:hypothetical protein